MPFPFLDLPPEIREKIYIHTLTSPSPIPLAADSMPLLSPDPSTPNSVPPQLHELFPHALLLTCHQIYHEVRPLYFTHNAFSLLLVRDPSPLAYFHSPDFRDDRRRIRTFKLVISRWGRRDFFQKEFAPLLEDMILNGSLRDLEVWVRRFHLLPAGRDNRMGVKEGEAVERLMGILRDPYLERVVLKTYMEGGHGSSTYLSQSDTLQDVTNFIDAPVEDVTKLIGCRRGHYPAGYHGPFTQIPIH
jgi:hypothetical protein